MPSRSPSGAALTLVALLLGGCAVGPDYKEPPASALAVPPGYEQGATGAYDAQAAAQWWQRFGDPVLDGLVAQAIAHNLDLGQARARLIQARESAVQAGAALLPSLSGSAKGGRNFIDPGSDGNSVTLGATASWEIDLFGGTRRNREAAKAQEAASGYSLAATRVSIIAETVNNYIKARLAQQQILIARETLQSQDDNLQIARWRKQAGLVSALDEEQARTQRAQTAASITTLEQSYRGALARIAVLTGQAPGEATRALETVAPLPQPPAHIATGIPADTLRQRPDVRAAERNLAAQTALIGVAQSALLPALQINGTVGTTAARIGNLGDVVTGSLFATISQLLFDGGKTASRIRAQRAATDGAFAAYRQSVLSALEDVQNALVAVDATEERVRQYGVALEAAQNSAILARSQYQAGLTDFQTLLEAERSLLSSRTSEAAARSDRALASVQLYRALGGGWQNINEEQP